MLFFSNKSSQGPQPKADTPHLAWIIVVFAIVLAPLLVLVLYGTPQSDDYCYGGALITDGLVGGAISFWRDVNARASASLLIMTPHAISQSIDGLFNAYRLTLGLLVAAWIGAVFTMTRLWFSSTNIRWIATFGFAATFLGWLPNYRELAIWLPSAATYFLPTVCMSVLIGILLRPFFLGAASKPSIGEEAVTTIFASALALLASLANEFSAIGIIGFALASYWARFEQKEQRRTVLHAAIILSAIIGIMTVLQAPSNGARAAQFDETFSIWQTLFYGPLFTLEFLAYHLIMPGHIAWYLALVLLTNKGFTQSSSSRRAGPAFALATILFILAAFAAGQWGIGDRLPGRAQNQLHLVAGLTFSSALILSAPNRWLQNTADFIRRRLNSYPKLLIAGLLLTLTSPTTWAAYNALLKGEAAQIYAQAKDRMKTLAAAPQGASVELARFSNSSNLVVSYDLPPGPPVQLCLTQMHNVGHIISKPPNQ